MKALIQYSTLLNLRRALAALTIIVFLAALAPPRANAAATASDNACNDNGANGTNGGSGFGAWSVTIATGGGTYTTTDTTINGNGCSTAWGIYTGTNTSTATSSARPFTSANGSSVLQAGQTITADMHNGGVQTGGSEGLTLYNANSQLVFELHYNGNDAWYIVDKNGTTKQSSIPYAGSGMRVTFTLTSASNYSMTVKEPGVGAQTTYGPFTGSLANPANGQSITQMRFYTFDIGSGNNLQFNNIGVSCPTPTVTTQPGSTAVCSGATASFTAASTNASSPAFQWQVSTNSGSTWNNVSSGSGGATANYTTAATTSAMNGYEYRCVVTDACGTAVDSSAATLTVNTTPSITTTNLPALTIGSPYSQTVSATGGSGYTWSISAGALPSTLTINSSNGVISGTYNGHGGTANFTVEVTTSSGCSTTQALSIAEDCSASITLSPTSLPNGTVAASYGTQTLSGNGGATPYTFAVTVGALPAGLSLNTNTGAITGTPTSDASKTFTVTATDNNGCIGTQFYTVTPACPAITVSGAPPSGTTGTAYSSTTFTASGANGSYTFSKTSGTLPAGLALSSGGVLSGTPTAAGTYGFTVTATDTSGCTGSKSNSVTISCPTISVSPASLPSEVINAAYTTTVTSSGGSGASTFTVGSGLPTGLSLSTNGVLSGTPTVAGGYSFTITATDTNGCMGSTAYSVTVTGAAPVITTNPQPQTACNGSSATFTVAASGTDSYAWYKHANAGWGSAWTGSGSGTIFLSSSTDNNNGASNCDSFSSFGDINTPGGSSWGLYGGTNGDETVVRTFPAALTSGQVFQIDMDNGFVNTGVQVGFSLHNSNNNPLFSFYFQGGGTEYVYYDGSAHTTSVGYTATGLRIQVIVGTGNPASYSLLITPCGGSTVEYSGAFATTGAPDSVVLFNHNTSGGVNYNLYFNSMYAGSAYDNADNYSGGWSGSDKGDASPISGATNATYTTSTGNNGDRYYAIASNSAGDAASTTALLTVNPLPTVSVNSATVCAGGSATLTATTSASSPGYLWSPGGATTSSITVSPASTTTYTVTVTDGTTGCANSGSGTVTVHALPTVSVNSATVCAGGSATLTATTSASSPGYLWSPGGATTSSITVSPGSTTTYTVTVTDGTTGCANSGSGTVTVNPLPTVSVNSATVCAGSSATLTATTSASSPGYLWSPGGATTSSITVSPASTTTYTVTVTDGTTGCANSGSGTVTVNPQPVLTLDITNQAVCAGSEVTWTVGATGSGLSYQWQRDGTNLVEGSGNFTGTTNATLTNAAVAAVDAQDTNTLGQGYLCVVSIGSCSVSSTLVSLTVNPLPTVSVNSATVCAGSSATLTATTSASNPSYLWSDSETTASITVSPATTTTYTVTVTDGTTGCANSGSGTVTVNPLPTVSVNSATVCAGSSATLTATTSAGSPGYLWSPGGATTSSITVSPASITTYTVTVTDGTTGCANSGSGTVTVHALPTVSVNSATVCAGSSATLTATTSASSPGYLWSPGGATASSITVSPASTTTYTVTVTDGTTGCANSGSGTVTVNSLPTITLGASPVLTYYSSTNANLPYTATSGSPDGYSITYDSIAQAAGFSNVALTSLPASPITLTVPIAAGTNAYNGTLTVNYSSTGCNSTNYAFTVTVTNALSTNVVSSSANPADSGSNVTFIAAVSTLAPSLAVPGGTVQFQIDGSPFGSPATLSNGVAVSAGINSLSRGYHTNEADYAGDTNVVGSTNTLVELIDTPPVAGLAIFSRSPDLGLIIAISDLLTNATDVYDDILSLVAVSATSTNGAAIYTNDTFIFYSPPAINGNVTDSFSYTVADTYGITDTGTVMVTIQSNNGPSVNITGISTNGNGTVTIDFAGIPGVDYLIQATPSLSSPIIWTTLSTNMAGTNGLFQYTDLNATNYSSRFYRTATQ